MFPAGFGRAGTGIGAEEGNAGRSSTCDFIWAADRARTDNEDGSDLPAKVRILNGVPTHAMAHASALAMALVAVGSKYGQCVCAHGLSMASVTKAERKSRRLSNLLLEAFCSCEGN